MHINKKNIQLTNFSSLFFYFLTGLLETCVSKRNLAHQNDIGTSST